ncbi:MAG: hypothetical protein AB7F61_19165 [Desulfobulbus sp.]
MNKTQHRYLCADCGRETTRSTDESGFGLCKSCEAKLNKRGMTWNKQSLRSNHPGHEHPLQRP